jgi:hypothetical protein
VYSQSWQSDLSNPSRAYPTPNVSFVSSSFNKSQSQSQSQSQSFANRAILPATVDFSKHADSLPVVTLQAFNIHGLFNVCVASVQAQQTGLPLIPGADEEEVGADP